MIEYAISTRFNVRSWVAEGVQELVINFHENLEPESGDNFPNIMDHIYDISMCRTCNFFQYLAVFCLFLKAAFVECTVFSLVCL